MATSTAASGSDGVLCLDRDLQRVLDESLLDLVRSQPIEVAELPDLGDAVDDEGEAHLDQVGGAHARRRTERR